ncbi:kinesin-like protein KIN-14L [Phalaenopsis equestris]|uniref:kinesin-like protein KIN-14L n=1 Tax=Phalaenopsis equestris TaxID=78828 RepID=UPI0009E229D8|nr:kinesin-like protein KIN-14L [Phalaenopsis equestris]
MGEQRNRWSWDLPLFEPRSSLEREEQRQQSSVRKLSLSPSTLSPRVGFGRQNVNEKFRRLKDQVKRAKQDYLNLRQEASDLREYSNAKLDRVTRYLGVLADRTRKLGQAALEAETRIAPLLAEKKSLFNELLTNKGNIKVFCRVRPPFEDEGPSVVEFPDELTVRVDTGDDSFSNSKKDYEFDRVYGPHIGQGEFFHDVRPFIRSAIDGYNVSIFAYGQSNSGKTHTMEGASQERGLYQRSFEELFDLSNLDTTSTCQYKFHVTAFDLYNEQVRDLLVDCKSSTSTGVRIGLQDSVVDLVQENANNPIEFSQILKAALMNRGADSLKASVSHLVVTIHISYTNLVTRENVYSKLSLVDLPGSECFLIDDAKGDQVTDLLHVSKSLSALGDVLSSLTLKKEPVPYENSRLTKMLADSIGGCSKTLLITHICPSSSNLAETLHALNFSARARNAELSLGNRDTIKKWKDAANDSRKEIYEKEKEVQLLKQEIFGLKSALKDSNDQCILLFNEVQKAWKVSFTLQADVKSENTVLADKLKIEKEQSSQLRNQVASLLQVDHEQKVQIHQQSLTIQNLQAKIKGIELQLGDALGSSDLRSENSSAGAFSSPNGVQDSVNSASITKKLEEELSKRDALIEKLHQENEKLFDRLSEKSSFGGSPQVSSPSFIRMPSSQAEDKNRSESANSHSVDVLPLPSQDSTEMMGAIVKTDKPKTPAGEYLTAALMDFDPDQFESFATVADGANKLLMLVLAAVIKAGAAREHEILAEIRDAVFAFIRKMEPKRVMDTVLVSRVRILYIRSLLSRSPELQSMKVSPVERFLEKANTVRSRSSSRGSSPGKSAAYYDSGGRSALIEEHIQGFKVNIRQEKKSKLSSIVLKLRGIDEETWRQHVTGGKLREITEEAKAFALGNKALAALFVHTPAGELQRQIRSWLAENFEFLSVSGGDALGGTSGEIELLSTAIMDGWMAGLGSAQLPHTDALGLLLSEYTKRVYTSQLQHLKDIAGTLAMEEAENQPHVNKLRSALESVDHKRRKILQQMRSDTALLSKEEGGSPIRNPSTAAEDARLASLIALDEILKQVGEIMRQASASYLTKTKKDALLASLDELLGRMPSLLDIDHPCAKRKIFDARREIESMPEDAHPHNESRSLQPFAGSTAPADTDVTQWNVLQFNTGSTSPFIIKCGANSNSELVIKADSKIREPKGNEIIRVLPRPSILSNMNYEEIKQTFDQLPEAVSFLALARTADGTRARYSRLFRTLAMKVPSLKELAES